MRGKGTFSLKVMQGFYTGPSTPWPGTDHLPFTETVTAFLSETRVLTRVQQISQEHWGCGSRTKIKTQIPKMSTDEKTGN